MVGTHAIVVVELHLEAVAVIAVGRHGGEGGVALGADGRALHGLAVDGQGTELVLLVRAGLQESLPVLHPQIDGVDLSGGEEPLLVAQGGGGRLQSQGFALDE